MIKHLGILIVCAVAGAALGATTNLPSVSRTDFVNALASMNHGDTLIFPTGSANWASAANVTKSVTIQGTSNATIITNTSSGENTFVFLLDTELDNPIRVTGIKFHGRGNSSGIFVDRWQKNVRIDNCAFAEMRRHGIQVVGFEAFGLIDNCRFTNNYTAVENNGNDGDSWTNTGCMIGTTNCVVIEDCYFENNNASQVSDLNNVIYVSNGGGVTFRSNYVYGASTLQNTVLWDSHGNNDQVPFNSGSLRGTIFADIRSNYINAPTGYRHFYIRGGTHVMADNTILGDESAYIFSLTEEECWADFSFPNQYSVWPAPDQITNTWIVNNTYNGSPVTDTSITNQFGSYYYPNDHSDRTFIQLGRDYFITNDSASIPLFSTNNPVISGGAYGVSRLAYPHPLRGGGAVAAASNHIRASTLIIR